MGFWALPNVRTKVIVCRAGSSVQERLMPPLSGSPARSQRVAAIPFQHSIEAPAASRAQYLPRDVCEPLLGLPRVLAIRLYRDGSGIDSVGPPRASRSWRHAD